MGACPRWLDADPGAERGDRRNTVGHDHRGRVEALNLRRVHIPITWQIGGGAALSDLDHTLIMGVVNVTPDSFSDGGDHLEPQAAIEHGLAMVEAGADVLDIGGESTRPGAEPVPVSEELDRVIPVIVGLAASGVPISVDTSKAAVARTAISAGASIVNDISALADPDMPALVAATGVGIVLMHMQGEPRTMQADPQYADVVGEVTAELGAAVGRARDAGIAADAICLDPGIGFGKDVQHNVELLGSGVERLRGLGHPVMVGASRKSFLSHILGQMEPKQRETPTVAAHVLAVAAGASVIRSHNVVAALQSARIADAIVRS